ncbi:MAG: hypothetical protein Q6L58_12475 [Thermostichales cyanobacterium BF3_bins_165]
MPLGFYLLDIAAVESDRDPSTFDELRLAALADTLLKTDDLIQPILVTQLTPVRFRVLAGHFQYFAALKANQLDPTFDEIRAIIVPGELQGDVLKQYELLGLRSEGAGGEAGFQELLVGMATRLQQLERYVLEQGAVIEELRAQNQEILGELKQALRPRPMKTQVAKLTLAEVNQLDREQLHARLGLFSQTLDEGAREDLVRAMVESRPFHSTQHLQTLLLSCQHPQFPRKKLITKAVCKKVFQGL